MIRQMQDNRHIIFDDSSRDRVLKERDGYQKDENSKPIVGTPVGQLGSAKANGK